ncbi:MAG: HAMP domain-containing protein [Calditrichaeota bacterium]|nr:HAMP domain-containing protein [Calditrichota bacterium]HQU71010.1 HAMP domain-containing protein [Calditrichia bacterium]
MNLRVKIAIYILIGAILFSGLVIFVASFYLNRTLTDSLIMQGRIIAGSISELAAERLIEEDAVGLRKILENYRNYLSNEYVLIVDADYNVAAHTYTGDVPAELVDPSLYESLDFSEGQQFAQHEITVAGRDIYDITLPIKEGLLGYVRVGLRKAYVADQVRTPLLYIGLIIAIGTLAAIAVALMIITVQVTRPVLHLVDAAKEISMGNFDAPVEVKVKNELQMLGEAIDRMRESLKTSLERLKTRSTIGRF